ncbi:hypothetical protein DRN58_00660 [Thermococci archaeon]|nr:MAG: hypothetical protein DRN41_00260 [Thermococci archaeon]RLG01932.1 MAG: hypothetical protein DRN58_00660 [Thermococci archaeon]
MPNKLSQQVEKIVEFYSKRKEVLKNAGYMGDRLAPVKYKIAILSTKGGVGKTTVTVNLAFTLKRLGYKVGILDVDLHGPSVPKMIGAEDKKPELADTHHHGKVLYHTGIKPVEVNGVKVMSLGLFWPSSAPIEWRGPFKSRIIKDMIASTIWGNLDFLLFDMPPGSGDEVLTILTDIPPIDGIIIVTTPQEVSTNIARKAGELARSCNVPILGVIENMSWYICPYCGQRVNFGRNGGKILADVLEVPLLGRIPFNVEVMKYCDEGVPIVEVDPSNLISEEYMSIAKNIIDALRALKGGNNEQGKR